MEEITRAEIQAGFEEGQILATAQNFARSLVNEPGNVLTPTVLGQRAKAMCTEAGLKCEVHSTAKLHELGMGAFRAVAQGSAEPPALIVMTYEPARRPAPDAPVLGLVGKGITFDTGGISIKPAEGMEKMKYDMAGAAAMIGAMRAIAQLKPTSSVIGVVCSAENMPDGKAFKPGDVVTAMSGKTIEIVNTDAEGRLVLADGLHYAKTLGCTHLINAATLTGACVIALGQVNAGFFSNDETASEKFLAALIPSGEKLLAPSLHRRLPRPDQKPDRRHHEHRQEPLGRSHQRRHVPQRVRRRNPLAAPRYRRLRLERRVQTLGRKRPYRHRRPLHRRVDSHLHRLAQKS